MTVGEALTEARCQAGLSVEELSERTKIRGTIIRSIEQDDYEVCGGDLYVRGYVRSIAGAVGIDAQPLIREYDLGRTGGAGGSMTPGSMTSGSAAGGPTVSGPTVSGPTVSGPTGRHAESYPRATPPETAQTASDQPAAAQSQAPSSPPEFPDEPRVREPLAQQPPGRQAPVRQPPAPQAPAPQENLNTTRYDMPAVTADPAVPANPAVTSYDLPRVPDVPPSAEPPAAEFTASDSPTAEFPGLLPPAPMPVPPAPVPPAPVPPAPVPPAPVPPAPVPPAPVPPAPVPPGTVPPRAAETRYDLAAIPEEPSPAATEDLMAAGYDLGPAGTPADAQPGTQVLQAIGYGQAPPPAGSGRPASGPAGAEPKNWRGLFAVAAVVVVVVLGALGYSLASRGGGPARGTVTSPNMSAAANASASAAARAKASAAQASASASAQARASASSSASAGAGAQRVISLPVASVMAFGPDGTADGDNPGMAANAVSASPSVSWATQWYVTPKFGMLKHGTGLLLDLGGKVTVTTVRLDLSPYQGTNLQLRVGNDEALRALHVVAAANDAGGTIKLTVHHPVAARYLLIWFTQLPPNGAGHYQETVSHLSVAGHR